MTCTAFNCSFLLVCFCFYLSKAKRTLLCQGAICGQLPALSVFIEMDGGIRFARLIALCRLKWWWMSFTDEWGPTEDRKGWHQRYCAAENDLRTVKTSWGLRGICTCAVYTKTKATWINSSCVVMLRSWCYKRNNVLSNDVQENNPHRSMDTVSVSVPCLQTWTLHLCLSAVFPCGSMGHAPSCLELAKIFIYIYFRPTMPWAPDGTGFTSSL